MSVMACVHTTAQPVFVIHRRLENIYLFFLSWGATLLSPPFAEVKGAKMGGWSLITSSDPSPQQTVPAIRFQLRCHVVRFVCL